MTHTIWLWLWFLIGALAYMLKRAYYLVTGPNPIANSYGEFARRCWIPLLFRLIVDSGFYWITFIPAVLASALQYYGLSRFSAAITVLTQYGFFALFFGLGIDVIADTIISKVPGFKDFLPQMPPPLPSAQITLPLQQGK